MAMFIPKPIIVRAEQYDGTPESMERIANLPKSRRFDECRDSVIISSTETSIRVQTGDYVIHNDDGTLSTCSEKEFEEKYVKVSC